MKRDINWHKFPQEKPNQSGYYLVRGKGGIEDKVYYYICLWIKNPVAFDLAEGFYYNGNEFKTHDDTCEWLDLRELE